MRERRERPARSHPRIPRRAVVVAFVVAAALRFWSLGFALPDLIHEDEPRNWITASTMVDTGTLNPHFFNYPSLMIYLTAAWQKLLLVTGAIDKLIPLDTPIMGVARTHQPAAFLGARGLSLLAGVGLCFAAAWAGWIVTQRRRPTYIVFAIMAVAPLAVRHSRFLAPDIFAAAFYTLTVAAALALLRRHERRDYLVAGVATGLAIGSKYTMVVVFLVVLVAHGTIDWQTAWERRREPLLAFGAAVGTFVLTTPFAILSPREFVTDVRYEIGHYANGHPGFEGNAPVYYLQRLAADWWWLVLIAAVAGAVLLWRAQRRHCIVLLSAIVPYYLYLSSQSVRFERNIVAIVGPIAVFAGYAIDAALRRRPRVAPATNTTRSTTAQRALAVVLVACFALPLYSVASEARTIVHNPRSEAERYLASGLPKGSRVFAEAYTPWIDASRFQRVMYDRIGDYDPAWFRRNKFDYLIASSAQYERFFTNEAKYADQVRNYRAVFEEFCTHRTFVDRGLTIKVLTTDPTCHDNT